MSDDLTLVLISWNKRRQNNRLLFGTPRHDIRLDWQRKLAAFRPGDVFAYERWEANKFGTQHWSIHIVQAGVHESPITKIWGVNPGAIQLTEVVGARKCKSLLSVLDALKKAGLVEAITPRSWMMIGHYLCAGLSAEDALSVARLPQ